MVLARQLKLIATACLHIGTKSQGNTQITQQRQCISIVGVAGMGNGARSATRKRRKQFAVALILPTLLVYAQFSERRGVSVGVQSDHVA